MDNRKIVRLFALCVSIAYILFGLGILFWKNLFMLDGMVRLIFGGMLLLYGIFRLYRVINFDKFHE